MCKAQIQVLSSMNRLGCVYFSYLMCIVLLCVCIAVLHTLVAGLLASSQYPEGPATGHLGTGFSWFPCV